MVSSGMLRRVVLLRTDDSEEPSARFEQIHIFLRSVHRLLVAASVVASSPILVTLMKEALGTSESSVLTRATRRNIPEDIVLYKNPARISQETHYVSATELSRLMLCKI
jgi:hypothetical protein